MGYNIYISIYLKLYLAYFARERIDRPCYMYVYYIVYTGVDDGYGRNIRWGCESVMIGRVYVCVL